MPKTIRKNKRLFKSNTFILLGKWPISKEIEYFFVTPKHRRYFRNLFGADYPTTIATFESGECSVFMNKVGRSGLKRKIAKYISPVQLGNLQREFKKSLPTKSNVQHLEKLAAFNNWAIEISFALEAQFFNSLPKKNRHKLFEASTRPEWPNVFFQKRTVLKDKNLDLIAQYLSFGAVIKQLTEKPLIEGGKSLAKEIRKKMGNLYYQNCWLSTRDGVQSYTDKIPLTKQVVKEEKNILHGLPASLGKAKGKACVAQSIEEAKDIKNDEILVSTTTSVHYEPYMAKASAFITEIGGITCHAAIIAREHKKPCLVSVKGATTYIKTGDTIEVDTEEGIVKILK